MIARTWRGATKAEDAETYLQYLHETGFSQYRATPGNLGVLGLRRVVDGRAEFLDRYLKETIEKGYADISYEREAYAVQAAAERALGCQE